MDWNFRDNGERLSAFIAELNTILADPSNETAVLVLNSSASPEGTMSGNINLANKRAEYLRTFILTNSTLGPSRFQINANASNWPGLAELIAASNQSWSNEALKIIKNTPEPYLANGKEYNLRRRELINFKGGAPWKWLEAHVFADLRYSEFSIVYNAVPVVHNVDTVFVSRVDTLYIAGGGMVTEMPDSLFEALIDSNADKIAQKTRNARTYKDAKPVFALRSNLLVPLLNAGFEIPMGNRWSFAADCYYPWLWRDESVNKYCFELLGGDAELRYYFGKKHRKDEENWKYRLCGHSLAIFGAAGYFDLGWDFTGHQGEYYMAGLDYTYAVPLGKGGMHMEFDLGIGYLYMPTTKYNVYTKGGKLFRAEDVDNIYTYIGPVKAGISLVVPLFGKKKTITAEDE